jgi:hypothetical protein
MLRHSVFYIFSALLLGACVNNQKMGLSPEAHIETNDKSQLKKILEGDPVVCSEDCPESVAAFFLYHHPVKTENGYSRSIIQCSATLIAEDKVLTNRHCIEGILKEGDVLADDGDVSIEIKFPKVNRSPFLVVKGKKVLKTSQDFHRHVAPDFAIIQLAVKIKDRDFADVALPRNGDRVDHPMDVGLFPVYFDSTYEPTLASIHSVRCTRRFDNPLDIFSSDMESPLFRVDSCSETLVPGNSGAGVFSSEGLVGVLATGAGEDQSALGTTARCFEDCDYSDDDEYMEISKQLSFLAAFIRNRDLTTQDWNEFPGFQWNSGVSTSLEPSIEWNSPWADYVQYMKQSGRDKLKQHFTSEFIKALFPVIPSCIEKQSLGTILLLPMMNMEVWDLRPFAWEEKVTTYDSRRTSVNYSLASGNAAVMPVKVSVSAARGKYFMIEAVMSDGSVLPAPIKKINWRIPICR